MKNLLYNHSYLALSICKRTTILDDENQKLYLPGWYFRIQHVYSDVEMPGEYYFDGNISRVYESIHFAPAVCGIEQLIEILREKLERNLGFKPLLVIDHNISSLREYRNYLDARKNFQTFPFPYNVSFRIIVINPINISRIQSLKRSDTDSIFISFTLNDGNEYPSLLVHEKDYKEIIEYFENEKRYDILLK